MIYHDISHYIPLQPIKYNYNITITYYNPFYMTPFGEIPHAAQSACCAQSARCHDSSRSSKGTPVDMPSRPGPEIWEAVVDSNTLL